MDFGAQMELCVEIPLIALLGAERCRAAGLRFIELVVVQTPPQAVLHSAHNISSAPGTESARPPGAGYLSAGCRRASLMFKTIIFFLSSSEDVRQIDQDEYVRLVRGEQAAPAYAGQRIRVADWYVALRNGRFAEVENETYSFLSFDCTGRVIPPGREEEVSGTLTPKQESGVGHLVKPGADEHTEETTWLPSTTERALCANSSVRPTKLAGSQSL